MYRDLAPPPKTGPASLGSGFVRDGKRIGVLTDRTIAAADFVSFATVFSFQPYHGITQTVDRRAEMC